MKTNPFTRAHRRIGNKLRNHSLLAKVKQAFAIIPPELDAVSIYHALGHLKVIFFPKLDNEEPTVYPSVVDLPNQHRRAA